MNAELSWIRFSELRDVRPSEKRRLLELYGTAEKFFEESPDTINSKLGRADACSDETFSQSLRSAVQITEQCLKKNISVITPETSYFPMRLSEIPDFPYALYMLGNLPAISSKVTIAVVGTRKCSEYGSRQAYTIAAELAQRNAIVVTGLAAGCDSRAAEGALSAGGTVIGIIGTAIDKVYPVSNRPLYKKVLENGAILSENPPGSRTGPEKFISRNRLIAGISNGTVIIEAPVKSGAMHTARFAEQYNRDLFALPGLAGNDSCAGSNSLIRDGAKLIASAEDVLIEYPEFFNISKRRRGKEIEKQSGSQLPVADEKNSSRSSAMSLPETETPAQDNTEILRKQLEGLTPIQLKIVSAVNEGSVHVDEIIETTGLQAGAVLSELTLLQITGIIRQEPGKRFSLNIATH